MPRTGRVVEAREGSATISTNMRGVCEGCSEAGSCSPGSSLIRDKSEIVQASDGVGVREGDVVEFELPEGQELRVSLLIWAVPLAGLVGGVALGAVLAPALGVPQDPAAAIGALVGLAVAFALLRVIDRRSRGDQRLVPRVTRVLRSAGTCGAGGNRPRPESGQAQPQGGDPSHRATPG